MVSDSSGSLISGTCTHKKNWTFDDLSHVVLNIKEDDPPPELQEGEVYKFTLMGVCDDKWVYQIGLKPF